MAKATDDMKIKQIRGVPPVQGGGLVTQIRIVEVKKGEDVLDGEVVAADTVLHDWRNE